MGKLEPKATGLARDNQNLFCARAFVWSGILIREAHHELKQAGLRSPRRTLGSVYVAGYGVRLNVVGMKSRLLLAGGRLLR